MGLLPKFFGRFVVLSALVAGALVRRCAAGRRRGRRQDQRSIPFASTAQVPAAVRDECQLQTKVPEFVSRGRGGQRPAGGRDRSIASAGRVLEMEITDVHAPGGGAFSGPKWMTVKGELYDRGKQIGSFRAKRSSGGGAFAAYKGTCGIIGRCAKTLGQDIATWLASPTQNAQLGELH